MKILTLKKDSKQAFSYLAGINRPINPAQVTKLAQSVNKMGIIRPVVVAEIAFIDGKKKPYIIDGQHLFNALIRNNMDIPYVTIDVKDKVELVEKIALLNASSKNWAMIDYITAWASLSSNYVKLNHYYQVYDIELTTLAAILAGFSVDGGATVRNIKDGSYEIGDEKVNVNILDSITDILKIIPRMDRVRNRYAIREYTKFRRTTTGYNHATFLKKLTVNKEKFLLVTQQEGNLSALFTKLK